MQELEQTRVFDHPYQPHGVMPRDLVHEGLGEDIPGLPVGMAVEKLIEALLIELMKPGDINPVQPLNVAQSGYLPVITIRAVA